jgi:hypothetical protein
MIYSGKVLSPSILFAIFFNRVYECDHLSPPKVEAVHGVHPLDPPSIVLCVVEKVVVYLRKL